MSNQTEHADGLDAPRNWCFTFGCGHAHPNKYVKIYGSFQETRDEMFRRWGKAWCMQYTEKDLEGAKERWGITELKEDA
jgi:hypothetical protein